MSSTAKKIASFDEVLFISVPKLKVVDAARNKLSPLKKQYFYSAKLHPAQSFNASAAIDKVYKDKTTQPLEEALQQLWKLDKLDRLMYLAELQKLEHLDSLEHLNELGQLTELKELSNLKELKNLDKLKDIKSLDKLNHLLRLKHLDKLDNLKNLNKLSSLDELSRLQQLEKLIYLNKLDGLKKLDKLDGLAKVEELKILLETHSENFDKFSHLSHLERLDNLKRLDNLNKLSDLSQLEALGGLEKLTELKSLDKLTNLQSLYKLDKLEDLSKLERLTKLDQLHYLEKLDNMQDLSKLDTLKDEEVKASLSYLSKLEIFQGTNKHFIMKLFLSSFFDVGKIALVACLLVFVLTKNVSYQTFNRLVPYLGFGEADRVNIALSILAQDLNKTDFDKMYKNVEARVKREASMLFNASTPKGLNEYAIAENLTAYNYANAEYDMSAFAKKEIDGWVKETLNKFNTSYEYDVERLSSVAELQSDMTYYREASIFMKQMSYVKAFDAFSKIQHPTRFQALGHGRAYAFYMAFVNQPKELKTILEK
jgi:hypothetical protein